MSAGGTVVMGGALEVDTLMRLFLERASGGDVIVLRTSGSDGYNDYLYSELGTTINSVETILCHSREASYDPYVLRRIREAEGIWFAGGNQATYFEYWAGTPLADAVNTALDHRNTVVGGISAGMAVLASTPFSARNGTVLSAEALDDPYSDLVTVETNPLFYARLSVPMIFDTHFDDPDRRGRMAAFMARVRQDLGIQMLGIGLDEYTGALITQDGITFYNDDAQYEDDYAYVFTYDCFDDGEGIFVCAPGEPLTWTGGHLRYLRYQTTPDNRNWYGFQSSTPGADALVSLHTVEVDAGNYSDALSSDVLALPSLCGLISQVTDLDLRPLNAYPNPSADHRWSVDVPSPVNDVIIFDDIGNTVPAVYTQQEDHLTIRVADDRAGLYHAIIESQGSRYYVRLSAIR